MTFFRNMILKPFFVNLFEKIREPKKILGRWTMETCQNKIARKIDLSNEDHCGPCGYKHHSKFTINQNSNIKYTHPLKLPVTSEIARY